MRLDLVDAPDAEPLEAHGLRTVIGTVPSPTSQPGRAGASAGLSIEVGVLVSRRHEPPAPFPAD